MGKKLRLTERLTTFRDLVFGKLLLIFQMPKTGSQTVEASLRNCGLAHQIIRCHYLSAARESQLRQCIESNPRAAEWNQLLRQQMEQMGTLRVAIRLRRLLRSVGVKLPKLDLITGVREAVGVALSSIFENHAHFVSTPELLTPERCRELLIIYPGMTSLLEKWFDAEIKPIVGIDVYERPFPKLKGYAIYETHAVRMLLYRIEALDRLPIMLNEFLGCELPQVFNCNLAESKSYAEIYSCAKACVSLPIDFVHARYTDKFARHFYTPRELSRLFQQWTRGEPIEVNPGHREQIKSSSNDA